MDLGVGELGGASEFPGKAVGVGFGASFKNFSSVIGGDKATAGRGGTAPSVPIVENRMSMRGEMAGRVGKSGVIAPPNKGIGPSGDGRFILTGVARPEDGESVLILPIDIFLKKPHLPLSLPSLPSLDLKVMCRSVELCSAVD